jgi:predicted nuclease with TOPRIM domain
MKQNLNDTIVSIKQKIARLSDKYNELKATSDKLQTENDELELKLENKEEHIRQLEQQLKTMQVARIINNANPDEVRKLKVKINEYIREIDKVVHQLKSED